MTANRIREDRDNPLWRERVKYQAVADHIMFRSPLTVVMEAKARNREPRTAYVNEYEYWRPNAVV